MSVERRRIARRTMIQVGIVTGFGFLPAMAGLTGIALAAEPETGSGDMNMDALIAALKSIGGSVCLDAASKLETINANSGGFDLHLRRAELGAQDALLFSCNRRLPIESFSAVAENNAHGASLPHCEAKVGSGRTSSPPGGLPQRVLKQ